MAKKQSFSLAYLEGIKEGQLMPDMQQIREWLQNEYGFTGGDNDNLFAPTRLVPDPIYLPQKYDQINRAALNIVINALQILERERDAARTRPSLTIDPSICAILDAKPEFSHRVEGDTLVVTSTEFPEFTFDVPYKGRVDDIATTLSHLLESYSDPSNHYSLQHYKKVIQEAQDYGVAREMINDHPVAVSLLDNRPLTVLDGSVTQLTTTLLKHCEQNLDAISMQQSHIMELGNENGFTSIDMGRDLIMKHPDGREITMPLHGELGYLTHDEWQQLQETLGAKRVVPAEPMTTKAMPVSIAAPQHDDTLLIFDASSFFELCTSRGRTEEESWMELLSMTKKLKGIGKIIIPDYIADVEMRNIACAYNNDGEPEFVQLPKTRKPPPKAFQEFIKHAVRRHVNELGEVEYLAEAGADINGAKLIIWETKQGRERAVNMANAANRGEYIYREPNFGEEQITQLISKELDWKNPVNVITSDLGYIHKQNPPQTTCRGKPVSYDSTYGYMEGEFMARGQEIRKALHLSNAECKEHYKRILTERGMWNNNLLNPHIGGHEDAEGIIAVIGQAVEKTHAAKHAVKKPEPAADVPAPVAATPVATPTPVVVPPALAPAVTPAPKMAFAAVSTTSFGGLLKQSLHQPASTIAERVNATLHTEHKQMRRKRFEEILRGESDTPRSDVLYIMMEELDKLAAAQHKPFMPSKLIFDLSDQSASSVADAIMQELGVLERREDGVDGFIQKVIKKINQMGPADTIDQQAIEKIQNNESLPEPRVAAAIRDLLLKENPQAVPQYDQQYFTSLVQASRSSGSHEI